MGKLLLFMGFPALELYVLVQAGKYIGGLGVVAIVFASMAFGGWLTLNQGVRGLADTRKELLAGRTPTEALLGNLLVFLAGLLFIFPGFISDALGFFLLIPPLRALCAAGLLKYAAKRRPEGWSGFQGAFIFRGGMPSSQNSYRDARHTAARETVIDCTVEPADSTARTYSCSRKTEDSGSRE